MIKVGILLGRWLSKGKYFIFPEIFLLDLFYLHDSNS